MKSFASGQRIERKRERDPFFFYSVRALVCVAEWLLNKSDSLESDAGEQGIILAATEEALSFTNMTLARKPRGSINQSVIIITSVVITSPSSGAVMVTLDVVHATNPCPFPHLNLYSLNQHHIQSEWAKYLHVISRGVH